MAITDPTVALAVVNAGKSAGAWPGDIPADQQGQIDLANKLFDMATDAQGTEMGAHPAVAAVLAAAGPAQAAPAPAAAPGNPFGAAAPAPVAAPAPAAPVAPAQPDIDINVVIPGYDTLTVEQIIAAFAGINDDGVAFVKAYEEAHDDRGKIAKWTRDGAAAPAAAVTAAPEVAEADRPAEPWEGYDSAKIPDIVSKIEALFATGNGDQIKAGLAAVWARESSAKKPRASLLKKLKDFAENGVKVAADPEPADVVPASPFAQAAAPAPAAPVAAPAAAPANPFGVATPAATEAASDAVTTEFPTITAPVQGATQAAQAEFAREFPKPNPVSGIPEIPATLNGVPDAVVDDLAVKFNAVQARLISLHADAEGYSNDAKNHADELVQQFLNGTEFPAKTTVTQMEAAAAGNSEIQVVRNKQREWFEVARQYKAAITYYDATCKMISREQTRRDNEKQNAR